MEETMGKTLLLIVLIFAASSIWAQVAVAPEGRGTQANPYQIQTLANLYWLSQNEGAWNSYFTQTADIDASETATWFPNGSCGFYGWMPIGNDSSRIDSG